MNDRKARKDRKECTALLCELCGRSVFFGKHMSRRFSVVGLGKLGASMAAAIASRGHEVIGVDVNHRAVEALNAGRAPVQETGLQALIDDNRARLTATTSHTEAIHRSELTFVIVPTPSDERGAFSLQ